MNAKPHSHDLSITQRNKSDAIFFDAYYSIEYGDQYDRVWANIPGARGRLKRKVKRVIKRHDKHSLKAGQREAARQEALTAYVSTWGGPNVDQEDREKRQRAYEDMMKNRVLDYTSPSIVTAAQHLHQHYQHYDESTGQVIWTVNSTKGRIM